MKTINYTLALLFVVCFVTGLEAQYGYGTPYGNRYGRRQSTIPQAQEAPKEPEAKTAEELVDEQMPKITETIGLDPFEEAIVRSTLIKYVQQRIELQILKPEAQKMKEEYEKIAENQRAELRTSLPEDKYLAYLEMEKNRFKATKKKKKKKKKSKE